MYGLGDPETLEATRNQLDKLMIFPPETRLRSLYKVADAVTSGMLAGSRETSRYVPEAKGCRIERMKDKRVPALRLSPFLLAAAASALSATAVTAWAADADVITRGKRIAFDSSKGNCLACHHMDGGESPGDLGPPLIAIEARFPDKQMLRQHLWDPMLNNPGSRMPPFGRHRILSEYEIDMVVEYIYTL